jgi:4-amino-4-deoxy-L-arabinose transferase-like glycosyltransferase
VQINYEPFWEKPPLFFWLQVLSMKVFGINEFAARFPNAICGLFTLSFIFYIGSKHYNRLLGWLWVVAYTGSFLPHFYFKSGIIDPWFNLFIFSGVYFLFQAEAKRELKYFALAGIATGLAVLTKGPVGLLLVGLTAIVFSIIKRNASWLRLKGLLAFTILVLAVSFFWYGFELLQNGTWFIKEFIEYHIRLFSTKDAGHGGPFYYHTIVLLLGCFPASFLALQVLLKPNNVSEVTNSPLKLWMTILFWVVLVLFSIVKTKIVHYSSMCYLPLTFLAAYGLYGGLVKKYTVWATAFVGSIIALVFTLLPLVGNNIHWLQPLLKKDPFTVANLSVAVQWEYWLMIFGMAYFVALLFALKLLMQHALKGYLILFGATAMLIFISMPLFVPKIERYSQGSAIDFYKTLQGKDVYVAVTGFKSYAQYFYTAKPFTENNITDKYTLLTQPLDKPLYVVTKIHKAESFLLQHPGFTIYDTKGGFVVMVK